VLTRAAVARHLDGRAQPSIVAPLSRPRTRSSLRVSRANLVGGPRVAVVADFERGLEELARLGL
jgi:hypothetical protein